MHRRWGWWVVLPALLSLLVLDRGAPASAAGPGAHEACSGSVCTSISAAIRPSHQRELVQFELSVSGGAVADGTEVVVHQDPGVEPDMSTLKIDGALTVVGSVTRQGNGFSLVVNGVATGAYIQFEDTLDPGASGQLAAWAAVSFSDTAGHGSVTSTSDDAPIAAGVNLVVSQTEIVNPAGAQSNNVIPHGYASAARVAIWNYGLSDLSAGAPLVIRLTAGFVLGPAGVRWNVRDGAAGIPLTCSGSSPTWTCSLPAIPAGFEGGQTFISVTPSPDSAVGTTGTVGISIPAQAVHDVDPSDNSDSDKLEVGPVADVGVDLTVDSSLTVGHPATATLTVTNHGPDTASRYDLRLYFISLTHDQAQLTIDDTDGAGQPGDAASGYVVYWRPAGLPSLPAGESVTRTVRFTPTAADSAVSLDSALSPGVYDPTQASCPRSFADCDNDRARTTVAFVPDSQSEHPGGSHSRKAAPILAATGPDVEVSIFIGVALVGLGGVLTGLCRPRRSRT